MSQPLSRRLTHVRFIALLTAVNGGINVFSALTPALAERAHILRQFMPLMVIRGSNVTAVLAGFALFQLAYGLWRHKQTAWGITILVLVVSALSHLLKGLDFEEASFALLLTLYLVWQRKQFTAHPDAPSLWQGGAVVVVALLFTLAYGTLGLYLLDPHFSVDFTPFTALRETVWMFTLFDKPTALPLTGWGQYFADSIYAVGAITMGYGLFMLLRPVILRQPATASERERAQAIVWAHGRTVLANFVLLPDKAYWFSPGGSVVGYGVRGRTAVALGDPVGPEADAPAAIDGFLAYCRQQGWQAAFYETLPDYLPIYAAAGLEACRIGHEAVVNLSQFTTSGQAGRPFRNAINYLTKLNHRAEMLQPPHSTETLEALREVSNDWLASQSGQELQFSLGWFDEEYVRQYPVMVVTNGAGEITAFANLLTEFQKNEATVDLMRRRQTAEKRTMEFLFVSLFQYCQTQGIANFNLGLSALAGVGDSPQDPALEKFLRWVYTNLNQFYNFRGLHAFKEKFEPTWEPRYLVYPGTHNVTAVATTLARLTSGDHVFWETLHQIPHLFTRKTE